MVVVDELDTPRAVAGNLRGRFAGGNAGERFAGWKMENVR